MPVSSNQILPDEASPKKSPDISDKNAFSVKPKIALQSAGGLCFENLSDIICIQAEGNYCTIFFSGRRKVLIFKTLREVENGLKVSE